MTGALVALVVVAAAAGCLRVIWVAEARTRCPDCWHGIAEHSYSCAAAGCCYQKSYWDLVGEDVEG